MPILRAGPFASSSDSFLNESTDEEIYPVNCINTAQEQWPFKFRRIAESPFDSVNSISEHTTIGVASVNTGGFEETLGGLTRSSIRFAYQAAQPFTLGSVASDAFAQIVMQSSGSGEDWEVSGNYTLRLSYASGDDAFTIAKDNGGFFTFTPTGIAQELDENIEFGDYEFPASTVPVRVKIDAIVNYMATGSQYTRVYFETCQIEMPIN